MNPLKLIGLVFIHLALLIASLLCAAWDAVVLGKQEEGI